MKPWFRSLAWFVPFIGLTLIVSGSVLANIAYPTASEMFLLMAMIILVVYVPMNLLLYLGFLYPVLWFRSMSDDSVFKVTPSYFFYSTLGTVLFTSIISGFTDALMFLPLGFSMYSLLALKVGVIFLCFFLLTMVFQKLGFLSAMLIALGISLTNIFLWFMLMLFWKGIMVLIVIDLLIVLVILPCFYYWYREKYEKSVYGDVPTV